MVEYHNLAFHYKLRTGMVSANAWYGNNNMDGNKPCVCLYLDGKVSGLNQEY